MAARTRSLAVALPRLRSRWWAVSLTTLSTLGACSLLAPPDSELVGTRPSAGSGGGGSASTGGSAGAEPTGGTESTGEAGMAGEAPAEGGNSPGKPVDVGTPTGEWAAGPGLKTRYAAEVEATSAHRDYPRPQLTRRVWATLNGLWDMAVSKSGTSPPQFDGGLILVPYPLESQLSGVEGGSLGAGDFLWYRRTFAVPSAWRGQRILLHFGAVDWDASVRLNGTEVISHRGGYDGFSVDITEQLGAEAEQELVVRVVDPSDSGTQPRGKQALVPDTGNSLSAVSGIWQSVWLEPVPAVRVQGVDVVGDPETGVVTVTPELGGAPAGTTFRAIVRADGAEVARAESADGAALSVVVPTPESWSPDSPFLYDLTLELLQAGVVVDSADSYFGLRSVTLGDEGGASKLLLNSEAIFSTGVLTQGYWPEGLYTPPTDVALKADLTLIKNLGFNAVRVHEKLESERFYYWADQLGLLVWQDVPAGENGSEAAREQFSAELSSMVTERRGHPSLAVWTLFPQVRGVAGADVAALVERVQALAPSQLVIGASGRYDEGSGDLRDRPDRIALTSPAPDERGVVLGQYGPFSRAISGHTWGGNAGSAQAATDTARYVDLVRRARGLAQRPGLSAAFLRQFTDVENELDGLVTYDRAVTKVTAKTLSDANVGAVSAIVPLLQASEFEAFPEYLQDAQRARYTTMAPPGQWLNAAFNDGAWQQGPLGIGETADVAARVRTPLNANELWVRTTFDLPEKPAGGRLLLRIMYDEDTQVYVNGVRAFDGFGWVSRYGDYLASAAASNALVQGQNTIAVHTSNRDGGRYIDLGLWLTDDAPALRPADAPAATSSGLSYSDYDVTVDALPADISKTGPAARAVGNAATVGAYAPALAADDARVLRLQGYVEVVQDGIYTFFVDTDDGARLSIGNARVVEATRTDGAGLTRRSGNVALAKGKHAITIDYFANDNQGANTLAVQWAGPDFEPTAIPAGNLTH